ncbi:MAG: hypothetical protein H0T51_23470 [Pirellulales bacterium]|nr:hypothetical protein [Pirellulales bacterium]
MGAISIAATFVSLALALFVTIRLAMTPRDQWNRLMDPMGLMACSIAVSLLAV